MSANLRAFLFLIRWCEGTSDENGYRALYGHLKDNPKLFDGFADHPRISFDTPYGKTSAAGAYQFLAGTWDDAKEALSLPDFSPESQDQAAVWLIKRRGALSSVESGDLVTALKLCNREWASLPGSPYGQPTRTLDSCKVIFERAGGKITQSAGTTPQAPSSHDSSPVPAPTAPITERLKTMIPPFVIPVLATVIEALPTLMRAFKGDSKVVERNSKAVEIVGETIKRVTGESSVLAAAEKVLSDPTVAQQADKAFQDIYFDLVEVGGGIEAARKMDAEFRARGDSVWKSPSFVIALLLIPLVYVGMVSASLKLPIFPDWPFEIRVAIVSSVIGMVLGGIVGYYFGMMTSRNRAAVVKEGA